MNIFFNNQKLFRVYLVVAVFVCSLLPINTSVADHSSSMISESYGTGSGEDVRCLALNIYHEGRGESISGQKAIASVIMNRVRSQRYPDSICEVVWQPKQFSWTTAHEKYHVVKDAIAWKKALIVAKRILAGYEHVQIGDATHYHTIHVNPYWASSAQFVVQIGDHVFYSLDA